MQEVQTDSDSGKSRATKVLVSYRFLRYKIGVWRQEAVMLHCVNSDDIQPEFARFMERQRHYDYEMINYLPENLKRTF